MSGEEFESDVSDEQFIEQLVDYLENHHYEEIVGLLPSSTYMQSLEQHDMTEFFLKKPENFVQFLREAIIQILIEANAGYSPEKIKNEYKDLNIVLAIQDNEKLSEIKSEKINSPIVFRCVITGLNPREAYIERAALRCPNACQQGFMNVSVNAKRELPNNACPDCGQKLEVVPEKSLYKYLQRATLQEPPEETKKGNPLEYDAILTDLDVGKATVGDRKEITGLFRPMIDKKALLENKIKLMIDIKNVNDLEGHEELNLSDEEEVQYRAMAQERSWLTNLAKSFSPEVFADDLLLDVKKSILLSLVGGERVNNKRGDINILMLGDPSMAKSTLLKFADKIVRKSMYTSGKGASAAGITIGIVKRHDGTSIAQAGILPLCNHGFAFIDELDKMNPTDRSGLHEAMEQQTVSISKAGFSMTLPAQTTIISAANPKGGKWQEDAPVVDNINLMPTLLSRFDIKWCIRDIVARGSDELKADHILNAYANEVVAEFSTEILQKILNKVRNLHPVMTDEARQHLKEFFTTIRQKSREEEQAIIDLRQLEGLVRLSYAHAKIYFKETVDVSDVNAVISLYERSLASFGFDLQSGNVKQQTFEQNSKENQLELWWKVWRVVQDDETKLVDYDEFMTEITKYENVWPEHKAEQFWNKLHKESKILMTRNGWRRI